MRNLLVDNFKDVREFTLKQVYDSCLVKLEKEYPNNHTMKATMQRILQLLRDDDIIIFVDGRRGTYRWVEDNPMKETWADVEEGYEGDIEMNEISKKKMWKMCLDQYKMIETLKEANASLSKEVDEMKKKDRDRLLMIAKARQVAQKALVSSSDNECDKKPLVSTWSNEAVEGEADEKMFRKVVFNEAVEERIYKVDRKMRPHKSWKKEPVVKMSPNMGRW